MPRERGTELIDATAMLTALQRRLHGDAAPVPEISWTCGQLAATRPEPHIALSPEYIEGVEAMGDEVDEDYIVSLIWACGMEQGWRVAVRDALEAQHYGTPWPPERMR